MFASALRRGDRFIPGNWVSESRPIDRAVFVERVTDNSVAVRLLGGGYDPRLIYKINLTGNCPVYRMGV